MSFHVDKVWMTWLLLCNHLAHLRQAISWPKLLQQPILWCQMGSFFLPACFFLLCGLGDPLQPPAQPPSLHHRAGKRTVYFSWALCTQPHVRIIYLLSQRCPICQLTDKAQMFLTCQFWCQQLCFICSQIPCRVKRSFRQKPKWPQELSWDPKISQLVNYMWTRDAFMIARRNLQPTSGGNTWGIAHRSY